MLSFTREWCEGGVYLIDANVIITAKDSYYRVDQVPEFWAWLVHQGSTGAVKIPVENWDEVSAGPNDDGNPFYQWRTDRDVRDALLLDEEADRAILQRVLDTGYAENLTEDELANIGGDAFLIAYALADPERSVITGEKSEPRRQRGNRKVPDVCRDLDVGCGNTFDLTRALNFSTSWKP